MDFLSLDALGTSATVAVTRASSLIQAGELLADELDAIDRACSRFRDSSELRLLEAAAGQEVEASELFIDALDAALRAAHLTQGLVTPTLGASLRLAGYDRDFAAIVPSATPPARLTAPDWSQIRIDRDRGTVTVPAGVELDLGATAKALAADRAATGITDHLGCGVLVSLGGDIRVAGPAPSGGWPILVDDDHAAPGAAAVRVTITSGGLATSSTSRRRWRRGSDDLHHIFDPRTGSPASGPWRTVTVTAGSCLDANIASTAAVVLGEEAPAWLERYRLPARLVGLDGSFCVIAGWPIERAA